MTQTENIFKTSKDRILGNSFATQTMERTPTEEKIQEMVQPLPEVLLYIRKARNGHEVSFYKNGDVHPLWGTYLVPNNGDFVNNITHRLKVVDDKITLDQIVVHEGYARLTQLREMLNQCTLTAVNDSTIKLAQNEPSITNFLKNNNNNKNIVQDLSVPDDLKGISGSDSGLVLDDYNYDFIWHFIQ